MRLLPRDEKFFDFFSAVATFTVDAANLLQELLRADPLRRTAIRFGQAYLEHLLQWSPIGANLIYVAAAYNAGPARVARWREQIGIDDDPLLFLESIPMREPRVYVKKVLTNLWSYRARLGQPQPSLEALARNRWPIYRALDGERLMHAWN